MNTLKNHTPPQTIMGLRQRIVSAVTGRKTKEETKTPPVASGIVSPQPSFAAIAGLADIMNDTNKLRLDANYDNDFDIYDAMVELDPELNGAVRSVSLTANHYEVEYDRAKNSTIRKAIKELCEERLDFDDLLVATMRDLMVYGNSINKLIGRAGEGITRVQSLPIKQITITDDREPMATGYSLPPKTIQLWKLAGIASVSNKSICKHSLPMKSFTFALTHVLIGNKTTWAVGLTVFGAHPVLPPSSKPSEPNTIPSTTDSLYKTLSPVNTSKSAKRPLKEYQTQTKPENA